MINREEGILLPLAAVILFAVVAVMVALAIDTKRVKETQSFLSYKAEEICGSAIEAMPITRRAVDHAIGFVMNIDPVLGPISLLDIDPSDPDIDLSFYARLNNINFVSPNPITDIGDSNPWLPGGASGWGDPVTIYGHPDCTNSECSFSGDVTNSSAQYPGSFWTVDNFNGYLGCELTADVDTMISGAKQARARVVYRVRVKGPKVDNGSFEGRGVIVGIAPEVEIRERDDPNYPADTRFHFTGTFANNNPLNGTNKALSYNRRNWTYQGPPPSSGWLTDPFAINLAVPNDPAAAFPNQRNEALVRCYNPFVAARNQIMQSVLGRLGRLWNTRTNTQVLMVNPVNIGTNLPNWPTTIVSLGDDMMQPKFEMPYVNYQPAVGSVGVASPSGFLCPFVNGACSNPQNRRFQMMVSSQLRDCFYVSNAANGADTIGDDSIDNFGHEPAAFQSIANSISDSPDPNFLHKQLWGWTDYNNHPMTAEDIGRYMPTMEECPFTWASGDMNMSPQCKKPPAIANLAVAPSGLRGDVLSFFRYLNKAGGSGAYVSPGFFEVPSYTGLIANPEPDDSATAAPSSHVVLFLGKRLDPNPAEISAIRAEVDSFNAAERILVVVYMPADATDWDGVGGQIQSQLESAFAANRAGGDPNFLFTLVPKQGDLTACAPTPIWQCFRDYWEQELLSPGTSNGAQIADEIMREILVSEVVL